VRETSVKVSDYQYNQTYALGEEGEARPVRWNAPKVLEYGRFSEKTDVWAFAITMFEVWSEGKIPYFDILKKDLWRMYWAAGGRLARTLGGGVPTMIEVCWNKDPKKRPRFSELLPMLGGITSPSPSGGVRTSAIDVISDVSGGPASDQALPSPRGVQVEDKGLLIQNLLRLISGYFQIPCFTTAG